MNNKNYNNLSEEDFLKNKAKRRTAKPKSATKKKKKSKGKMHPAVKSLLVGLAILAGVFLIALLFSAGYYFIVANVGTPDQNDKNAVSDNFVNAEGEAVNRVTHESGGKKYYTFLATATDVGGTLTDVIMVANFHYDDKEPSVSILQIPRDTYVKVCASKLHFNEDGSLSEKNFTGPNATYAIKINEAFFTGRNLAEGTLDKFLAEAADLTDEEIKVLAAKKDYAFLSLEPEKVREYLNEENRSTKRSLKRELLRNFGLKYLQSLIYYDFGIPTDYLAQVNIKGFRGIVNAIDGVDLYIDQPMHYDDPFQDLHIHFNPGQHHLNGKKAEEFVRFRSYPGGDVDRLDAQKKFINAFLKKLLSFSTVTKIDSITTEVKENLYTDISFNNMLKFANKVLLMDLKEDVKIHTLPGIGEYVGGVSYFIADKDGIIDLVNEEFNVFDSPLIKEDFRIIHSNDIIRPAVAVTDEDEGEENTDETVSSSKENSENEEDNNENKKDSDSSDDEKDNDKNEEDASDEESENNDGENDEEVTESGNKTSDEKTDKNENETLDEDSENKQGSDEEGTGEETENTEETKESTSSETDDNYQLLLDMAA